MTIKKGDTDMTDKDMNDKQPAGAKPVGPDALRSSRRTLLKAGAVGAPLVLTFRSTSAWALSAGCLIEIGNMPIPGQIIAVDEEYKPLENPNWDGEDEDTEFQKIYISRDPHGEGMEAVADGSLTQDELRAMVYNNNIGESCLVSIMEGALN